jgi:OmpA-OmpF porin, OOP family
MKNFAVKSLLLAATAAASISAVAQTTDIVLDTKSKEPLPYAIDVRGVVVRSGVYGAQPGNDGLCWRTGYWTKELAANTPVVGSAFPAGCACDKDLMPKEKCEAPAPVAAEAPAPAAPAVKPSAEKITVAADALFDFDKAVLRSEGKAKLDEVAEKSKALKIETIIAVGHADRFGSPAYNQKLSERRAAAVKDHLVGKGIAADRVYTEGKGSTQPVTKADECKGAKSKKVTDCLQPDRRVTIEIIGTK